MYIYIYTHIIYINTYIYTYIHTYIHTYTLYIHMDLDTSGFFVQSSLAPNQPTGSVDIFAAFQTA